MDTPPQDLLEAIYDAALEPERWRETLTQIAAHVGGHGGHVLLWDEIGVVQFSTQVGQAIEESEANRLYAEHYGAIDPRRVHSMSLPVGDWLVCHRLHDDRFVSSNEFYQDFYLPVLGARYMTGARLADESGLHALLAVARRNEPSSRPFEEESLRLLRQMTPHLSRAARIHLQMARLRATLTEREAALDRLGIPLAIVDRKSMVCFANREAETILADASGPLRTALGRLRAAIPAESNRLEHAIDAAVTHRLGDSVVVHTGTSAAVLYCTVVPLSPRSVLVADWQRPLAMVMLTSPRRKVQVGPDMLASLFGLTAAESRLAMALADGATASECADRFAVAIATVRAQIRAIFVKVGVNRQA